MNPDAVPVHVRAEWMSLTVLIVARRTAAAVLATLLSQTGLQAQDVGRIAGRVQDLAGNRLAEVSIRVRGVPDLDAQTDDDGGFVLAPVRDGEYVITATLDGFAPATRLVRVVGGRTADVSLILSVRILEQVIVTADRTGERDLRTVPLSVSVVSDEQLERGEAHSVADLAGLVPSLTYSQNTGFAQLTIRGIGTNAVFAGSEQSSAVYLDGVYLARPASVLGDFLDLARVEVLRGPQGTLYGRNVVGGAINLITRLPTNERTLSTRVVVGSLQTTRAEFNLSGPIVRNRVLASGSVLRGVSDGFVRDLEHPARALGGTDVTATRGALRLLFTDRTELRLAGDFSHRDPVPLFYAKVLAVKPGFTVDNPSDLHHVRTSTPGVSRTVQYGGSAQFTWRPAPGTVVTSLFAARKLDYAVLIDSDSTELNLSSARSHEVHDQISEEVTFAFERASLTWTGGLFLFRDVDRQPTTSSFFASGLANQLDPTIRTTSVAAFGQGTIPLGWRLSGIVGLRYTHEDKTINNSGRSITTTGAVLSSFGYRDAATAAAWTPRFGVNLQLPGEALAYGAVSRGFKGGGFNLSASSAGRGFAPEWAWTYEAGGKWSLLRRRVSLNAAAFFTDYTDLQVQTPIRPGIVDIANAAAATIRGVELEGEAQPAPGWRVGGHAAWLDARYDRYTAVGPDGSPVNVAGRRLSNAPEWSGRAWFEFAKPLRRVGAVLLFLDVARQSTVFFTPLNDRIQQQRAYSVASANITIRPGPRWSVGVYARNVTDTDYITGTIGSLLPAIAGRPGEPRQVGVQLTLAMTADRPRARTQDQQVRH